MNIQQLLKSPSSTGESRSFPWGGVGHLTRIMGVVLLSCLGAKGEWRQGGGLTFTQIMTSL